MNVLLSIKPEFAEKILRGKKKYEFRKTAFRDDSLVDTVILYASAPSQQIVGMFTIDEVFETNPENLWERFGSESGIDDKERFMQYFKEHEQGYAFEISDPHRLSPPVDPRQHFENFRPPVSFQYANGEFDFLVKRYRSNYERSGSVLND